MKRTWFLSATTTELVIVRLLKSSTGAPMYCNDSDLVKAYMPLLDLNNKPVHY